MNVKSYHRPYKCAVAVAAVSAVVALAAGCASTSGRADSSSAAVASGSSGLLAAAQKEGTFTIYSALPQDNVNALLAAFEKKYPGITGQDVFLSTAADDTRMESEYKRHDTFDISINDWGADTIGLAKKGIFASYKSPSLSLYASQYRGARDQYLNIWGGTQAIAYNTSLMSAAQAPKTWSDLLKSQYRGKVGVSTPLIEGGAYWWYYNMDSWFGDSYLKRFAANKPVIESAPSGVGSALAAGQVPIGVVTAVTVLNNINKGAPLRIVWPSDGVFLQTLYMAIDSRAPHPNAARLFYNWLASPAGEKVAVPIFGYYSTVNGGAAPAGLPALSKMSVKATNPATFASKEGSITKLAATDLGLSG